MTTHDTPEAALTAALRKALPTTFVWYDFHAAAILAALPPGWCGHDDNSDSVMFRSGWEHGYAAAEKDAEAEIARLRAALERVRHEMYLPSHQHPGADACVGCDLIQRLSGTTLIAPAPAPNEP
jgi:hypothetical protein